jgi:catechol 2,3-dioxygenase-like lactoylglutathione lyase family enzyme
MFDSSISLFSKKSCVFVPFHWLLLCFVNMTLLAEGCHALSIQQEEVKNKRRRRGCTAIVLSCGAPCVMAARTYTESLLDDDDNVLGGGSDGLGVAVNRYAGPAARRSESGSSKALLVMGILFFVFTAVNVALSTVVLLRLGSIGNGQEGVSGNSSTPNGLDVASFFSSTSLPCGYPCATLCYGKDNFASCFDSCYSTCQSQKPSEAALASFLRKDAVHHAGLTVSNLSRSVYFYTKILGGIEVPRAGGDGWFGDTVQQLLTQKELLQAKREGKTVEQLQVADLKDNGTDTLAARYVSFGGVTIELLDYRARNASFANKTHLPYHQLSSSPSVVNAMHICLQVRL